AEHLRLSTDSADVRLLADVWRPFRSGRVHARPQPPIVRSASAPVEAGARPIRAARRAQRAFDVSSAVQTPAMWHSDLTRFLIIAALLGTVASLAPAPSYQTDRDTYLSIGRQWVVTDCSDLHCFRALVAWTLEHLPGPSLFKWKAYAAVANAGAAIALAQLC